LLNWLTNKEKDIFVNHVGLSLLLQRLEMEPSPVAGKKWPKSRTIPLDKIRFGGRKLWLINLEEDISARFAIPLSFVQRQAKGSFSATTKKWKSSNLGVFLPQIKLLVVNS